MCVCVFQAELRRAQAAATELLKEAQVKKQIADRKQKSVALPSGHLNTAAELNRWSMFVSTGRWLQSSGVRIDFDIWKLILCYRITNC